MGYSEDREVEPLGDSGDNNEQHTYSQRMGRSSIQSRRVNDDTSSSRYFCIVRTSMFFFFLLSSAAFVVYLICGGGMMVKFRCVMVYPIAAIFAGVAGMIATVFAKHCPVFSWGFFSVVWLIIMCEAFRNSICFFTDGV